MFIFTFMSRCVCHDGVQRTWERSAVFVDRKVFYARLGFWTGFAAPGGGIYEYFETPDQKIRNDRERPINEYALPTSTCVHTAYNWGVCEPRLNSERLDNAMFDLRISYRERLNRCVKIGEAHWPPKAA